MEGALTRKTESLEPVGLPTNFRKMAIWKSCARYARTPGARRPSLVATPVNATKNASDKGVRRVGAGCTGPADRAHPRAVGRPADHESSKGFCPTVRSPPESLSPEQPSGGLAAHVGQNVSESLAEAGEE